MSSGLKSALLSPPFSLPFCAPSYAPSTPFLCPTQHLSYLLISYSTLPSHPPAIPLSPTLITHLLPHPSSSPFPLTSHALPVTLQFTSTCHSHSHTSSSSFLILSLPLVSCPFTTSFLPTSDPLPPLFSVANGRRVIWRLQSLTQVLVLIILLITINFFIGIFTWLLV